MLGKLLQYTLMHPRLASTTTSSKSAELDVHAYRNVTLPEPEEAAHRHRSSEVLGCSRQASIDGGVEGVQQVADRVLSIQQLLQQRLVDVQVINGCQQRCIERRLHVGQLRCNGLCHRRRIHCAVGACAEYFPSISELITV